MYNFWKEEEIKELKFLYEEKGLPLNELYELFIDKYPNRTKTSLEVKIKKLKLRHTEEQIFQVKSRSREGDKNGMFGKIGPNKGLTKENSARIKKAAEKISYTRKKMYSEGLLDVSGEKNGMFGKEPWSKGQTKYTHESLMSNSKKNSIIGVERWNNYSEEQKNIVIGNLTLAANKAKKDTKIELIIKEKLENLNINFIKNHKYSRYVFDFYLPDFNFVIECQGDYWHGNPDFFDKLNDIQLKNIERDIRKKEYLKENNINNLFLWENEIYRYKNILEDIITKSIENEN